MVARPLVPLEIGDDETGYKAHVGRARPPLVAFERLAESTTTAFFDQDVLRALQDLRNTPAEVSPPRGPPPPGEVAPV